MVTVKRIIANAVPLLALVFPVSIVADEFAVKTGLSQPIVIGGKNIAAHYATDDFIFEWSHGWDLNYNRAPIALSEEERRQGLNVKQVWGTGGSVGYRITPQFDIRLEFKEHYWRVRHPDSLADRALFNALGLNTLYPIENSERNIRGVLGLESQGASVLGPITTPEEFLQKAILTQLAFGGTDATRRRTVNYRTREAGIGIYYRFFFNEDNTGFMLEPTLRWWPQVWNDLDEGKAIFQNRYGLIDVHAAKRFGVFFNVSAGYVFKM